MKIQKISAYIKYGALILLNKKYFNYYETFLAT